MSLFSNTIMWFQKTGNPESFYSSNYKMINPLNNNEYRSGVKVQRFKKT